MAPNDTTVRHHAELPPSCNARLHSHWVLPQADQQAVLNKAVVVQGFGRRTLQQILQASFLRVAAGHAGCLLQP